MMKEPKANFFAKLFIGAALATGLGGGAKMLSDVNNSQIEAETAEEKLYREKVAETGDAMAEKYRKEIKVHELDGSFEAIANKIALDYKSWFSESHSDDRVLILNFLGDNHDAISSTIGNLSESDQNRFKRLLEAAMKWNCWQRKIEHLGDFGRIYVETITENTAALLRRKLFPTSEEIAKKSLNEKIERSKEALRNALSNDPGEYEQD